MWFFVILLIAIAVWLIVRNSSGTTDSPESTNLIQDMFKDLTLNQRYAAYNFFDSLAECVTSFPAKQKVQERVRMAAIEFNIKSSNADDRLQTYGLEDMFRNLGSIPKGAALDSIIATAYGISLMASGIVQGRDAKSFAHTVFIGTLTSAGFSQEFIKNSLEKTAALMGIMKN